MITDNDDIASLIGGSSQILGKFLSGEIQGLDDPRRRAEQIDQVTCDSRA